MFWCASPARRGASLLCTWLVFMYTSFVLLVVFVLSPFLCPLVVRFPSVMSALSLSLCPYLSGHAVLPPFPVWGGRLPVVSPPRSCGSSCLPWFSPRPLVPAPHGSPGSVSPCRGWLFLLVFSRRPFAPVVPPRARVRGAALVFVLMQVFVLLLRLPVLAHDVARRPWGLSVTLLSIVPVPTASSSRSPCRFPIYAIVIDFSYPKICGWRFFADVADGVFRRCSW
jgi:hypothetical protein